MTVPPVPPASPERPSGEVNIPDGASDAPEFRRVSPLAGTRLSSTDEMLAAIPEGLMRTRADDDVGVGDVLTLYRAVFLHATEPIAIIDREGRYLEQNAAHRTLLGYSDEDLRGQSPAVHMGEAAFAALAQELLATGVARRELVSRTRGGDERVVDLTAFAIRSRAGEPVCYVGIKRDVTEQRRATAELNRQFIELRELCELADALGQARALPEIHDRAMDALQRVLHVNRAAILEFDDAHVMRFRAWRGISPTYRAAVEGYSPWREDVADPRPITVSDVDTDTSLAHLGDVIREEGIHALAFIPLAEGERLLGEFTLYFDMAHEWTAAELRFAGTVARHVAIAMRRHRREEELRAANHAKSSFLATMSHELRTPLNAIAGYTDLLDAGIHGALSGPQRDALRRVQANQRHLLMLIDDVLDFAKIESGHLQFDITNVPVQETLDGTRSLIEPQVRARELRLEFVPGDPGVTCRGDRGKIQQVLANLISNACKFTPAGGVVTMSWEPSGEEVRIAVRDTGQGIPGDKHELIFEPFVQLQSGFRRRAEGTGLGLAISRELARGMGGDLTVESAVGEGATFVLRLPRD